MTGGKYMCPVCGYPELTQTPRSPSGGGSYEICESCGFEFGVTDDDLGYTYDQWRHEWIERGTPWDSANIQPPPPRWDPQLQLAALDNPTHDDPTTSR